MTRQSGEDLQNPNYTGSIGRAWNVSFSNFSTEEPDTEQTSTALGLWLIEAPFVHAAWSYHAADIVHLRDVSGLPPAILQRPGATHEFTMHALDPKFENFYDPSDIETLHNHLLVPVDVHEQLVLPSDQRALDVARTAIQKCVDGELLPDSDYRRAWGRYFREAETSQP